MRVTHRRFRIEYAEAGNPLKWMVMRLFVPVLAALVAAAPVASAEAAAPSERRQVLILDSHIENLLASWVGIRTTLKLRGYGAQARDMRGRLRELEAPADDMATRMMLDEVARRSGFVDYADWLQVARSVLVAERYIADPPRRGDFEDALAELKGDPFLSPNQKVRLIASLRRTAEMTAVLRPLSPNVPVVAPYVKQIRETLGFAD